MKPHELIGQGLVENALILALVVVVAIVILALLGPSVGLDIFDDRFGKRATLIVSQVPVADWHARFPDPTIADAIPDKTIHNAYRLSLLGDSQRKLRASLTMPHT